MADPLFTPAFVGFAVCKFFTEVIDAAKSALKYREKCKIVLESVDKLQLAVDAASLNSTNWGKAESDGLEQIKDLLDKARSCATIGVTETKSGKLIRGMTFWRWGKLPTALMDIVQQIEKAQQNIVFVASLGSLTYVNDLKATESLPFIQQQVPPGIVGVDVPFNRFKASVLANHTKNKPSHLGIHGRGGAGKTLLAQMLHNDKDLKAKYGTSSILWITVGLDARVSDLYKKMGLFLRDGVFEKVYAFQSLKDQRNYLWGAFAQKKVFMILDDVWQGQCEQNHDMMHWLNIATAPGSTTLITTRSTSVLSQVHAESEVVLALSYEDSWKLFCFHAFFNGVPPSIVLEELAKEVCKECKGLPLALKVIGRAMVDKANEGEWRSALLHLKQSQPIVGSKVDDELFGRLRMSYDMLEDDVLKTCFLYLAAFPEDSHIQPSKLFDMWIVEGLFGESLDIDDAKNEAEAHLEILEKRSLIDWNRAKGYVQMHDILRDLALYIINKAALDECAYACFFHSGRVLKSFPSNKSLQAIKRMSFMNSNIHYQWPIQFQASNLQVCLLSNMNISIQSKLECFISSMTSLKYLDLSSNYQFNFEVNPINFWCLNSLMWLDLSYCESLKKLPENISELKCLMHLDLRGCRTLGELQGSIGKLKCLMYLDLSWCESLEELPGSICELKCLIHLDLSWCKILGKLPKSVGKLKCLMYLDVSQCKSLEELPRSIGELKCLTYLDLSCCEALRELPGSIGKLENLTHLNLRRCECLEELPTSIGELKCLTYLDLCGCKSLEKLPKSIDELNCLTHLDLRRCESLKELPISIGELKHLTHLNLCGCKSLEELPQTIGELNCLTHLDLCGCKSLKKLPRSIDELKCIKHSV